MAMVKNPHKNWKKMQGANELEKRINALLVSNYISFKEAPDDECLSYAEEISKLLKKGLKSEELSEKIYKMLYKSFYTGRSSEGSSVAFKKDKGLILSVNAILTLIWVLNS